MRVKGINRAPSIFKSTNKIGKIFSAKRPSKMDSAMSGVFVAAKTADCTLCAQEKFNATFAINMSTKDFGKVLAEEQLKHSFEKYLIIGFNSDTGGEYSTNCCSEQLALLLAIFSELYKQKTQNE